MRAESQAVLSARSVPKPCMDCLTQEPTQAGVACGMGNFERKRSSLFSLSSSTPGGIEVYGIGAKRGPSRHHPGREEVKLDGRSRIEREKDLGVCVCVRVREGDDENQGCV